MESKFRDSTHVPHVDNLAPLGARGSEIGKGVGRDRSSRIVVEASSGGEATATTASVASAEAATASAEATTTEAAAAEAATAAEAPSATKAHPGVCEAVGADLEDATLPVIAIKLLDSVSSIVGGFEDHDAGSLGPSIRPQVDVGADDTASAGCETVLASHCTPLGGPWHSRE